MLIDSIFFSTVLPEAPTGKCSLWLLETSITNASLWMPVLFLDVLCVFCQQHLNARKDNRKHSQHILWIQQQHTEPACLTLEPGYSLKTRNMAISAAMVFPEPVGAPRRTLVSVWYSVWKIWVWMGLKWVNLYRLSYWRFPRAVMGNGCRSSSSDSTRREGENIYDFMYKSKNP